MKNFKQLRSHKVVKEELGAGEWGTDELTNKYKSQTPGQEGTVKEGKWKVTLVHNHPTGEKKHDYIVNAPHQNAADKAAIAQHVKKHPKGDFHMWDSQPVHESTLNEVEQWELKRIHKDYTHLKALPTKDVHAQHKNRHRVVAKYSPAEVGGKQGMIDDIMRDRHGEKRMSAYHALPKTHKDALGESTIKEASVEDHEASMAFHHDKAQEAKKRGDNDAFEKHMDMKHQHAIARDELNARKKKREAAHNINKQKNESVVHEVRDPFDHAPKDYHVSLKTVHKDGSKIISHHKVYGAVSPKHASRIAMNRHSASLTKQGIGFHSIAGHESKPLDQRKADDPGPTPPGAYTSEEVPAPTGDLKKACWKGYVAVGTKMKDGRRVPNCVPKEGVNEEAEQDEEGDMSRYLLEDIAIMASELASNLEDDDQLEAWVQDKITRSHQYLDDVFSYAESQDGDLSGEDETPEDEDEMDYPEMQNEAVDNEDGKSDPKSKRRLETLVRLGLMDTSDLPVLRRAMKKIEGGQNLTSTDEKQVISDLVEVLVGIVTGDDVVFQKVRANVTK